MSLIHIEDLSKHFKILNRREGLGSASRKFSPFLMTIFDGAFCFTFTYIIPIGFVTFYPSQLFLRPEDGSPLIYFSPSLALVALH
jgi:ABC-type uncharacterized transport system permease subunit